MTKNGEMCYNILQIKESAMQLLKSFKPLNKENLVRLGVYLALELFLFVSGIYFTIAYFMGKAVVTQAIMCLFGIVAVSIADIMQGLCRFRIATPVYFFILAYAVCPTLGHTYGLYYYISWWDKLLHITGGVVFALFGAYLPKVFLKTDECSVWLCVICGFMFSLGISMLWEFVEYGLDTFFGTDMQKDSILSTLRSYLLNDIDKGFVTGELLDVGSITTTIQGADGTIYQIDGLLDTGKIDTMHDMLVEAAGALVFSVVYIADKGKHTCFHYLGKSEKLGAEMQVEPQLEVAVTEE